MSASPSTMIPERGKPYGNPSLLEKETFEVPSQSTGEDWKGEMSSE